jgi:hypothetical protein
MVPYRAPVYTPSTAPESPFNLKPAKIILESEDDGSVRYGYIYEHWL